jgi:putative nucleotidyltransferase with HDIG domain
MSAPPHKCDIDSLLEEVVTLPSLPDTVASIMRMVGDPKCSLAAVAKAISADPPLAMKTLRLVNTAYYGLRQKVTTIEHAVVLLGTKVIKNLAFTATVFDVMKGGVDEFFRHSVSCGMATRALIEACTSDSSAESSDEAFVFGLLHDIGKVIFEQFMPAEYAKVALLARERQIPWYKAELEVIGVDHAFLGARLAEKWKLPDHLIGGIAGHHVLEQCVQPELRQYAALVSIADFICAQCQIPAATAGRTVLGEDMWAQSGLTSAKIPAVMESFFEKLASADELMKLAS